MSSRPQITVLPDGTAHAISQSRQGAVASGLRVLSARLAVGDHDDLDVEAAEALLERFGFQIADGFADFRTRTPELSA